MRVTGVKGLLLVIIPVWAFAMALPVVAHAQAFRVLDRPPARRTTLLRTARRVDGLTHAERRALLVGSTVARPLVFEHRAGRYVGGVSYQLVHASPRAVLSALEDVKQLPYMLPHTRSARRVGRAGRDECIELTQGNGLVSATYTVRARRVDGRSELRFWLDRTRPHGIDDVWGYFRVEPFDAERSLVTVAVALDLGPGLARMLFEGRIQNAILGTPGRIRDFIEPRAYAYR